MIVLHPSRYVPENEKYPRYIGNSLGCPAVSEKAFEIISEVAEGENKDMLLWMID